MELHRQENTILVVVTHSVDLAHMLPQRMEVADGTLTPVR
jgi:lipoprotein-releasing system ATP-binding protein